MWFRVRALALVCGALGPSLAWGLPMAPASQAEAVVLAAATTDPVGAHAAIAQAQERLAEIDATITVLQDEADKLDGATRQRARDAVAALGAIRDTYRRDIDGIVAQGQQMTAAQLAVARTALTAPWTQFEQALDQDVGALKLGVDQRKAVVEARIRAEQAYWQAVITDLQASAVSLTAEQRAAIDARIARVRERADEAQARLTKLSHASRNAWSALKQGFVNSRQIFDDAYGNAQ